MTKSASRDELFIQKLTQIVLDNLTNEQFSVEELAFIYGISRSQLHKKLKKAAGKSISQFIREIRLEEAMKLLQQDTVIVSEVAYQVGFSSPTYFNTRFKDYFGYPPGEVKVRIHLDKDQAYDNETKQLPHSKLRKRRAFFLIVLGALLVLITLSFLFINRTPSKWNSSLDEAIAADSISQEKTIAVLPLKNWSGNPELEYISDGITDAIITRLAKIGSIKKVIPFTSMVLYKETDKSISEIASELGVKNVLQGSFQLSGDKVSIKLQMIDGITEDQFWESNYNSTWKSNEIFQIQATVTENVAHIINAKITESEQKSIQYILTSNKEAYRLYLQAEYQYVLFGLKGFENATSLYKRAIALDSTFTMAYLRLGEAYMSSGLVRGGLLSEKEAWSIAKPIYQKALILDQSSSGEYQKRIEHYLITGSFYYEWDLKSYEEHYINSWKRALVIEGFPHFDYARKTGKYEDALTIVNNGINILPKLGVGYVHKACVLYFLGRQEEAMELLSKHDELYFADYFYLMETAKYYHYLGAQEKSKKHLELFKKHFNDRPPIIIWLNTIHTEMEGKSVTVKKNLKTLEDLYTQQTSGSPAWFTALYYCHIKDYDRAFEWLQKSYDRREVEMTWLKEEPVLRPLRNDPRYLELYDKVGFSILDQ